MAAVIKRMNERREKDGLPRYVDPSQNDTDVVPHGFRSTFRDWAAERTNFPNDVVEMALAHAVSDKVEAAYRRGNLFEKRRKLSEAWAVYCASPKTGKVGAGKIVAFSNQRGCPGSWGQDEPVAQMPTVRPRSLVQCRARL
jgi:hypothetical protein